MNKNIILLAAAALLFIQCDTEKNPFLITKGNIGLLSNTIQIHQLDSVFEQDSIVAIGNNSTLLFSGGDIDIYEKGGIKLLTLSPEIEKDSTSLIRNIRVLDDRFVTEKGLNLSSTFKDVKDNYTISSLQNTISSVVVFLDEINVFITIDKQQLPENARYTTSKIEVTQVPDTATFKYFMIGWDSLEEKTQKDE